MIDKVFVTNRMMVLQLAVNINVYRYIFRPVDDSDMFGIIKDQYKDEPFILISCFGTKDSSIEPAPRILLNNDEKIQNLKSFGMVDYLNLYFDDITDYQYEILKNDETQYHRLFDKMDAYKTLQFIEPYMASKDKVNLLVHCDAGISRSGAVATSICDIYQLSKDWIHKGVRPNSTVMKIFKEIVK